MKQYVDGLVSVIIPVYNSSKYLHDTIKSALNQTYQKIELIIVDDCSTDNSFEIMKDYLTMYNNIKIIKLNINSGVAIARNKAMDLSTGRYVAFLDADDIWCSEKIIKQIKCLRQKKAAFSYTGIEIIDKNSVLIKNKRFVKNVVNYNYLLKNTVIATSSVLIDRYQIGDFNMPIRRSAQDYATWLMILRKGFLAYGIDEALVKYRKSKGSLSSNKIKNFQKVWDIQVNYEGINKGTAFVNTCLYAYNAFFKHFI